MNRLTTITICLGLVALALSSACTKGSAPESAQASAESAASGGGVAVSEARTIFAQRCVMCHGVSGMGDGVAAVNLNPKPRNYTDVAWQKSVTDDYLGKVIVEGGAAVGKTMLMPGNPDLQAKPQVVAELVKIIRGFTGR